MRKSLLFIALSLILVSCQGLFTPTLKVGVLEDQYIDTSKTIDDSPNSSLAHHLAQSLKMELKLIPIKASELEQKLKDKSIDIALSDLVRSKTLAEELTYTKTYRTQQSLAFIRRRDARALKHAPVGKFLDKKRIKWGVLKTARNFNFASEQVKNPLKEFSSIQDGLRALRRRQITIFICDSQEVRKFTQEKPFADITSFQWTAQDEEIVGITQKDSEHLEAFNKFITE